MGALKMTAAYLQRQLDEMFNIPNPSEVWVCGHRFDIEFFEVSEMHSENLGELIFNKSLIRVWSGLASDMKKNVTLHEVSHAAYEFMGLSDSSSEDPVVDRLTTAHLAVLRDPRNKVFVDWLLAD
jgi:hypothetical protein